MSSVPPLADECMPPAFFATRLPRLAHIRQHFADSTITDIPAAVAQACDAQIAAVVQPGMRVAITAGSRGITNMVPILATIVASIRRVGGEPFLVAAMGSHGGATSAGQRAVLTGYGITEQQVGCPISSAMETVQVATTEAGVAVHVDQAAYHADAIMLVNRVKPHSILVGDQGSGLMKMAALGLGKAVGANLIHTSGLAEHLLPVARQVLAHAPVKLGIAIVENARDQTEKIVCVPTKQIEETDRHLLAEARALLPSIPVPFDPIDVLIIDQIGKNFSGTGMDPNVIGMHRRIGGTPQRQIGRIVALDLSDESHGNAHGVGMADVITERLRAKIDWQALYTNALTAGFFASAKLPIACATAQAAVALAMQPFDPDQARVVRIHNTAHLEDLWVSPPLLAEITRFPGRFPGIAQISEPLEISFPYSEP